MDVRISHTHLVDPLVRALNETDCDAERTGAHGLRVSVPWLDGGGDRRQARMEILFFIRSWGLPHADFEASLV